jgi:hypothetical protein
MSEKRPRWESEMMGGKNSNPKACINCMFTQGEPAGPESGCCQIFEYPESKPAEVYWNGADCEYYEKAL